MFLALLALASVLNLRACLDAPAPPTTGEDFHQSFRECLDVLDRVSRQVGECRQQLATITPCPDLPDSEANGS